jgi:hypothetical protein
MRYLAPPDFSYALDDLPVSGEPLEEFLFNARRGNCEYFAAAMAVMLRMTGVPSRIIAGYRGGAYNDSGGYYMVSQSNAHVWAEAWDEAGKTWRRYDPTPAADGSAGGVEAESGYGFFRMYLDYINYQVSRIFMEYEGDAQFEILEAVRGIIASPGAAAEDALEAFSSGIKKYAAAPLFAALAAAAMFAVRRARRRAAAGKYSRDSALRDKFIRAMRRRGFEKKPGDGLEEFVRKAASGLAPDSEITRLAEEFTILFESYYFKDIPLDGPSLNRLSGLVRKIKTAAS